MSSKETSEAPPPNPAGAPPPKEVDSRSSTSEEYEIMSISKSKGGGPSPPELDIVVGQGKEEDLKQNLNECLDSSPEDDSNNGMANESLQEEEEEGEHTTFHNITYLGVRQIELPKNEEKIQSQIREANQITEGGEEDKVRTEVVLSIPRTSDGLVLMKNLRGSTIERFPISRIIFFARGTSEAPEATCFAFTSVHADEENQETFRCFKTHIFRCQVPEAVSKVFVSFAQAFKRSNPVCLKPPESFHEQEAFLFELTLEIKEKEEGKNLYDHVPRHKGLFKLRTNVEKKVIITVQQISNNSCILNVERCFGMLVSPGRNVRHADMQLLEHVTMATSSPNEQSESSAISHVITGTWDPSETAFAFLNQETPPDVSSVYMTIAADLVIQQVAEPVRFMVETKAKIFPTNEKYWYYARRNLCKQYQVRLKRSPKPQGEKIYDVCGIDISEEIDRTKLSLTMQLASLTASTLGFRNPIGSSGMDEADLISPQEDEDEDDGEEPLLSGYGDVSKDCSGTELDQWSQVLQEWDKVNPLQYPKQLPLLVRRGIPEALRGEVWQRVTGVSVQMDDIIETYRILTTKESPDEKVIMRDIHRTFPAHEFFKESGGVGQESLYRISKAYSIYDSEVGYCQGQSFLIAALLLQMPEEQAFGVLVKVMHRWGLRDMFKENFEQLQLRLYQLDRLIETNMPDLWQHFADSGIESHMYASQWFLTIFTAKFPLFLVFRVLDCFLLFGFDSIFQVALGILKVSKKDLLLLDFEGLMRYFRVNIPKRYRSEDNAKHLMAVAASLKLKKLNKYEKEWVSIKAQERAREDPVIRLERENKKLLSDNLRLDTENDNLARQLVNSKIEMRKEIDKVEDEKDYFEKEYGTIKMMYEEAVDEKKRLGTETGQLKTLLKREVDKLETELLTRNNVIAEYKIITSQLSEKLEKAQNSVKKEAPTAATTGSGNASKDLENADERIRELELELAQTKLALVETECKFQDLTHQYNASISIAPDNQPTMVLKGGKWFTKTLSSIKETATAHAHSSAQLVRNSAPHAGGPGNNAARDPLKKSTSVDAIKTE